MARTPYTPTSSSLEDALSGAYGIAGELRDELQEWYDNLPENFQNGDKGQRLEEAISGLEDVADYEVDVPEVLVEAGLFVTDPRPVKRQSRADRCSDAVHYLRAVIDAAQEWLDAQTAEHDDWVAAQALPRTVTSEQEEQERSDSLDTLTSDVESFISELEGHADSLEGVEFPGMFG